MSSMTLTWQAGPRPNDVCRTEIPDVLQCVLLGRDVRFTRDLVLWLQTVKFARQVTSGDAQPGRDGIVAEKRDQNTRREKELVQRLRTLIADARIIELFQGAESFSGFVDSLKELSTMDWIGIGAGILLLLGPMRIVGSVAKATARALRNLMSVGKGGGANPRTPTKAPTPDTPKGSSGGFFSALGLSTMMGAAATFIQSFGDTPGETFEEQVANQKKAREQLQRMLGLGGSKESTGRAHLSTRDDGGREAALDSFIRGPDPLPTLEAIRDKIHQPSGTQNVKVTNPTPVHAPINVTVYATTNADPGQIANQVGARVKAIAESSYSDGGGGW